MEYTIHHIWPMMEVEMALSQSLHLQMALLGVHHTQLLLVLLQETMNLVIMKMGGIFILFFQIIIIMITRQQK